ncbi:MAG: HAD family hydrolase, partial [Gemmatimonadetes bacterium]|nr:HAD family hydrolase [Gemmatimonadota bacterium]
NPDRFVVLDPELPVALMDQKKAGKKLLLITNSEWSYAQSMMEYAFDRYLKGMTWRDLFDVIIVSARKPAFFGRGNPLYEIVDEKSGHLKPTIGHLGEGGLYHGGSAAIVEQHLGLEGDEILYVGDHLFADVRVSKAVLRWRTALILRELEDEVRAVAEFEPQQAKLREFMVRKEKLEAEMSELRLRSQRSRKKYGPKESASYSDLDRQITRTREAVLALDAELAPLAVASGELRNKTWGPLMRAGNDKSLFARQVEQYADVYTSRCSNFLHATPFGFLRAPRMNLPHDPW